MIPLPEHKCGLYLEHNPHNSPNWTKWCGDDCSIASWVEDQDEVAGYNFYDLSDDAKKEIVEKNEVWTIQWYPRTSIGFCTGGNASLSTLLRNCDLDVQLSEQELNVLFPSHSWLEINHNVNRNFYESVAEWIKVMDQAWISDADRQKAIDANDVWVMWWIDGKGDRCLFASDLELLLNSAKEIVRDKV